MRILLLAAALLASSRAAAVADPEVTEWETVGAWTVAVDHTLANGCFMVTNYEGGTVLRLGFSRLEGGSAYLMIGNDKWRSIDAGKGYPLSLQFDQEEAWTGEATAIDVDGDALLYLTLNDVSFFTDFMRKHGLKITYADRVVANLSLAASTKAMKEVVLCQQAMDKIADEAANSDPFNGPPPEPSDPFAPR